NVAWRRFPYALTVVAAAPRGVAGPFELLRGSADRVVVRRLGLTIVFRRLSEAAILPALRGGRLDVAPVPLGDLAEFRTDPASASGSSPQARARTQTCSAFAPPTRRTRRSSAHCAYPPRWGRTTSMRPSTA